MSGRAFFGRLGDDAIAVGFVQRPERLLAVVDAVERRLRQVDEAARDQRLQVAVEERQQQRRDVVAVGVGVHQQDQLVVAQAFDLDVGADAAAERRHQVLQLLVRHHLLQRRLLGVQDLAAQREDRLRLALAALLGRAAGRIALDEEQLALARVGRRAVGQLAGQVEAVRHRRLARHRLRGRARRLARLRRQRDALDDLRARGPVLQQEALERRADRAVDLRLRLRAAEPFLGLTLELRLLHVHRQDADDALADVLGGQGDALGRQVLVVDERAHRLDDRRPEPLLVRPALRGRDAVHVRPDRLLVRLGPLHRRLDAERPSRPGARSRRPAARSAACRAR